MVAVDKRGRPRFGRKTGDDPFFPLVRHPRQSEVAKNHDDILRRERSQLGKRMDVVQDSMRLDRSVRVPRDIDIH